MISKIWIQTADIMIRTVLHLLS